MYLFGELITMNLVFIILIIAIFAIWFLYPTWSLILFNFTSTPEAIGQFGDSFGGLNTLFSGFAFTGIIVSIYLQSKELKETRNELHNQKVEMKAQADALNKQVFESTLFQLLQLHSGTAASTTVNINGDKKHGRESFTSLFNILINDYMVWLVIKPVEDPIDETKIQYQRFHDDYGYAIGHYFRNVYQIMKFIDNSTHSNESKKFYVNLLRAQMSTFELALLFYNCISNIGCEKFKPLIEKYEIFEHLPAMPDFTKEQITIYSKNAYGTTNHEMLSNFDT